ncbi:MAG: DEAD/DEAH box helicase, partial [Proteobacteria bacterium]|nr:DEAD/DEAH box helicase [Pseudomonadota bacterium]
WDQVFTFPRTSLPAAGRLARVEYLLQSIPVASDRLNQQFDEQTCAVMIASVTIAKGGVVKRTFGRLEPVKLGVEDAALRGVLFGVEELVPIGAGLLSSRYLARRAEKRAAVGITRSRVPEVLPRLAATGRFGWIDERGASSALVPLAVDTLGAWRIRLAVAREGTMALATGVLIRGDETLPLDAIRALAGGDVAITDGRALIVETHHLTRWLRFLRHGVTIPLDSVPAFLEAACRQTHPPELAINVAGLSIVEQTPVGRIVIRPSGRSGYEATAVLMYGEDELSPLAYGSVLHAFGKRLVRRQLDVEHQIVRVIRELGASSSETWQVPGPRLRTLCDGAARHGIEVWYDGNRLRASGKLSATVKSGIDWFDLSIDLVVDEASAELPALLAALRTGKPLIKLSDGTSALLPPWLEARAKALGAAQVKGGALRFRHAETLMLAALVDGIDDVALDARFAAMRDRLDTFVGLVPRDAPDGFGATLRDYQRDGLGWLVFLRELGLGGCLADDMGLGKTIQVLALLEGIRRARGRKKRKPSLVVAPRSLVFHWLDEARRFAPELTTLEWHGAERTAHLKRLRTGDLVVTTYATMRIDQELLAETSFELIILDEAHTIKNAETHVARAARSLSADHRLALTGTPVENRLDDLASIFDFLNPGLLGRPAALRALGEVTHVAGAPPIDADLARARTLGRVLRPFLLRRTKAQVLTELPAKTECVITCRLEGVERRRYDDLKAHYRAALLPKLEAGGVARNAIVVLEALLRLRQAALHPGLLDARKVTEDSAKLDALVEHLHEAGASGHRALVFSQFTSLLAIVSARLEREGIAYEYLDGQPQNRRERVAAFQGGDAPVFLLSLKAGGTGLNLTAADHVFLLDPWWNPAVEAQAIDRVHRIGQQAPVTAYRLVAEDTVEEKILAMQAHKRALFDHVFEDTGMVANLSVSDLRNLLA